MAGRKRKLPELYVPNYWRDSEQESYSESDEQSGNILRKISGIQNQEQTLSEAEPPDKDEDEDEEGDTGEQGLVESNPTADELNSDATVTEKADRYLEDIISSDGEEEEDCGEEHQEEDRGGEEEHEEEGGEGEHEEEEEEEEEEEVEEEIEEEQEENNTYEAKLAKLSELWIQLEITHRVSQTASDAFWKLGLKCFPDLLNAKKVQDVKRKVPQFQQQRIKLYDGNVPKVRMDFLIKKK